MQITIQKAIPIFFMLFSALMFLIGLAFIWHYIPPNNWLGVMPEGNFVEDELWYQQNSLMGWALAFCGITTMSFAFFTRKQSKRIGRYVIGVIMSLVLSAILASIAIELITSLITS